MQETKENQRRHPRPASHVELLLLAGFRGLKLSSMRTLLNRISWLSVSQSFNAEPSRFCHRDFPIESESLASYNNALPRIKCNFTTSQNLTQKLHLDQSVSAAVTGSAGPPQYCETVLTPQIKTEQTNQLRPAASHRPPPRRTDPPSLSFSLSLSLFSLGCIFRWWRILSSVPPV